MHGSVGKHRFHWLGHSVPPPISSQSATIKCETCRVRALSLCAAIMPAELAELDELSTEIMFDANSTLFDQDEPAEAAFNITTGAVRLSRISADGRRQIVGFALPGDFLGLSMADRTLFSAETIAPTRACRFPRKAFSALLDTKPHLLKRLHVMASHELALARDQVIILSRNTVEQRMAVFILTMRDRWQRVLGESVHVPLPMTRRDIGDFLGMTMETASRQMTKFAREALISIAPDGVTILNEMSLKQIALLRK